MKRIIITLLISVLGIGSVFSQHEIGPALSSQLFSRINYNPAGIGNSAKINIFNLNRFQWLGFDGHPTTSVLNVHSFVESLKSGFGGAFTYDKLGYGNQAINAKFVYAYNLDISDKGLLAFGLSAGIDQFSKDFSDDKYTAGEELDAQSKTNPDFDFGMEYSTPHLLLGASVNHLGNMKDPYTLQPTQTYYGYARAQFAINKDWVLAPSVLYMKSSQSSVIDVNAVGFYQHLYWGGLSMRVGASMSALVGFEWDWLRLGYAYEMSLGQTADLSSNTHELMLSFIINTKSDKPVATKNGKPVKGSKSSKGSKGKKK